MKLSDFDYDLPTALIAQAPLAERTASRLLMMDRHSGEIQDKYFSDIVGFIEPKDLLVFNNTKVIPARLYGRKQTGGKVELLLERLLSETQALAHIRANKAPKCGSFLFLEGDVKVQVIEKVAGLYTIEFSCDDLLSYLDHYGHVPLPPYITRDDQEYDQERYQTVFAKHAGAVAAPTAGLHFDKNLLERIVRKGVKTAEVTLHVGAGTFQPVRNNDLSKHVMHAEYVNVSQDVVDAVTDCRNRGGRVFAVGTTTVRSLEAASHTGQLMAYSGDTKLFITPGYYFKSVDAMITNFHLPLSTLLMLVSAFSTQKNVFNAYNHAVNDEYRFFSYGDAMLLI
jgi:S-adenosylmethionine:tRNA ribosyltransferase-isomerase